MRKRSPMQLGINDASKSDTSVAFIPRMRNQFKGDTAIAVLVVPGWARKYARLDE